MSASVFWDGLTKAEKMALLVTRLTEDFGYVPDEKLGLTADSIALAEENGWIEDGQTTDEGRQAMERCRG